MSPALPWTDRSAIEQLNRREAGTAATASAIAFLATTIDTGELDAVRIVARSLLVAVTRSSLEETTPLDARPEPVLNLFASAGQATVTVGNHRGVSVEEVWPPNGEDWSSPDRTEAELRDRWMISFLPVYVLGSWDLRWEHIYVVRGSAHEVSAYVDDLIIEIQNSPPAAGARPGRWLSLVAFTLELASQIDRADEIRATAAPLLAAQSLTLDDAIVQKR